MEHTGPRTSVESPDALGGRRSGRESVIDHECFFEGTFRTPGNMRIEGAYQGVIECQGTLLIAETGQVKARIAAGNLTIAGQFQGEVQCDARFEILKSGRVSGTVSAKTTVVHEGAFFEGEIRMGGGRDGAHELVSPPVPRRAMSPEPSAPAVPSDGTAPNRRRPSAAETPPPAVDAAPEPSDPASPPRVNGRGQPGRDILPNRTGEP